MAQERWERYRRTPTREQGVIVRYAKLAVFGAASTLLLLGCSGKQTEYDYSIPEKVCGIDVQPSNMKPLLPPGKEVKESFREIGQRSGEHVNCGVVVDKGVDLSVSFSRQTGELDIAREAADKYTDLQRISLGRGVSSAAVGDDGAVAWMACLPQPQQPRYEMPESRSGKYDHVALEIRTGKVEGSGKIEERRTHIENFLRAYAPGVAEAWCT
ncbi:hypothetical protein [Streptomyces griseus]|uniref:hypothetical protein n=1 Tax=Streptomyces griseus TaxID=1911 RepID=UPI00343E35C6